MNLKMYVFVKKGNKSIIKIIIISLIFSKILFSNNLRLFKINVFKNFSFFSEIISFLIKYLYF